MLEESHIIISFDEAHFYLNGHVTRQSCKYSNETYPQLKHENSLHLLKVTVWAALPVEGPYFHENRRRHLSTVGT